MSVAASRYAVSRASGVASGQHVRLQRTAEMDAGNETITVRNYDAFGGTANESATVTVDTAEFTDVLKAGETPIKAVHITELRAMLDNICAYYGLSVTEWAEDVEAGVTPTAHWAAHVAEIQQTITRMATYINAWDANSSALRITLPTFETPSNPKLSIINTLRNCIPML